MPITPYISNSEIVTTQFLVNGENNGLDTLLLNAKVQFELNKIPFAKFSFVSSNVDIEPEASLASDLLKQGDEIEMKIKFEGTDETLFKGIIKSLEKTIDQGRLQLKVECKDLAYQLTLASEFAESDSMTFEDKLIEFTKDITLDSGLQGQPWGKELVSMNVSTTVPWDYLLSFLDAIGIQVVVQNGLLKGVDILQPEPDEKYFADGSINIFSWKDKVDDTVVLSKAIIEYWDSSTQALEKMEATQEANPNVKVLRMNATQLTPETLQRMADNYIKRSAYLSKQANLSTVGNLHARVGDFIIANKVNPLLDNQKLIISKELHNIESGSWTTEYDLGLQNEKLFSEASVERNRAVTSMSGSMDRIFGLMIGKVTSLDEDPKGELRIKVNMPTLSPNGEGKWARVVNLFASKDFGSFFLPEVGDEVIVSFIDGHPDYPIVLGSVYSSSHMPSFKQTSDNYVKGWLTKADSKFEFDDEKKRIELSTAKGNKFLISEDEKGISVEDENKNKIVLNDQGIRIESASAIEIKAAADIKMEGASISISSSGPLELKGSIININ